MADTSDREIVVQRIIHAPREHVFDAWSDVDHISNWWGPAGFTTTTEKPDFRTGGEWVFTMHGPDGTDYANHVIYDAIERPSRIQYRHGGGGGEADGSIPFVSTVEFVDVDEGTEITLRMTFPSKEDRDRTEQYAGATEGGRQTLGRLEQELHRQQLDRVIQLWAQHFEARDVDSLVALYADDAVIFDAIPPFREGASKSFVEKLVACLPYFPERFSSETAEQVVHASGDVAAAHRLFRYTCDDPEHPACQTWLRHTLILTRQDDSWKISHDHVSLPFDPETSKALFTASIEQ